MKLFGFQRIDGGLVIATASGQQNLVALPDERSPAAARVVGERILALLDDPAEPHAHQSPAPDTEAPSELADGLAAVGEGVQTTRVVFRALRLLTRRRR